MTIRTLPPLLINQIAAGEVIERPASVVKELVENAIDAGASRIAVAIENGGRDLVEVTDDGGGIAGEQLLLAVAPHATSKIAVAEDLDAIATMGFRGEALASIASVSRLSIRSRPLGDDAANRIDVEGEQRVGPRPDSGPVGTTVTVRNLFFNTPARRKFLRADTTESSRVMEVVQTLALSHPGIGFALSVDGRSRVDLPPASTPRDRVLDVIGREFTEQLLDVKHKEAAVGVWGVVGTPEIARSALRCIRVFLNGRPISDRTVNHAIREAYRGLIAPDRYPTVVLMLKMDPAEVDVNVHPAKAEVRFRNQSAVHTTIRHVIGGVLRGAELVPAVSVPGPDLKPMPHAGGAGGGGGGGAAARQLVDHVRQLTASDKGFVYSQVRAALATEAPELLDVAPPAAAAATDPATSTPLPAPRRAESVLAIHDRYLVTEDERGIVIIDQHALHERVMFERLKARIAQGNLESQRLLMPVTLKVDQRQQEKLETLQPLLQRLGIDAQPLGPTTVAVHAFTTLLFERGVEPDRFISELLEAGAREQPADDPEAALHEVLDMMACKAAVKSGDRLAPRELEELMQQRELVDRSSRCPHGRPTTLHLSLEELDRQFGRR